MLKNTTLAVAVVLMLSGCATMFNPGPTNFVATSDPSGATVEVMSLRTNESFTQTTPATFTLDLASDYRLTFELAGYRSEEVVVRRTVNGWFFGSILLGVLPAVVDFATGSMWEHTMTIANVEFIRGASNSRPEAFVTVGLTDEEGTTTWTRVPLDLAQL